MTGKRYVAEGFAKIKYQGFYLGLKGLGIFFTGQLSGGTLQKYSYSYFTQNSDLLYPFQHYNGEKQ